MGASIEPAGLRLAVRVEHGYIRFDIQKRCTIKQIHILNLKSFPLVVTSRTIDSPMAFGRFGALVANIPWGVGSIQGFP